MYPNLTAPLLTTLSCAAAFVLWLVIRRPMLRRLALRQVARRRTEAVLVISGSLLGTAIIVGALVVGDTLGFSVRQAAFQTLGPIDERIVSATPADGEQVATRLRTLTDMKDVDGVLTARVQQAAALRSVGSTKIAEPRVLAWDVDFTAASAFGTSNGPSGLTGPAPAAGQVVVNEPFATALRVRPGEAVTLYLSGRPRVFTISRVVPARGIAGTGFGATQNRNAFLSPGALAAQPSSAQTRSVTWVSNRGGVLVGNDLTTAVSAQIRSALGPLVGRTVVDTPKADVLRAADRAAASLGALFLMIGSFSIIAGALLLVNIFVMLADERKGQLGMLRAAGLKRSGVVGAFAVEGACYAVAATVLGVGIGIGVGRGVAFVAAKIFSSWSTDGSGLDVTFAVTSTSLVNGAALGLVISLATILATSVRISRFNIIAAIRDLEAQPAARTRRRLLVSSTAVAAALALLSVPTVAASQPTGTFLLPSLALLCATPLLSTRMAKRWAYSVVSTGILLWTLLVNVLRPAVYDSASMAVYVVSGSLAALSAVVLLSENQSVVLRPVRRLVARPSESALASRLALAYPVAKRFRTGATLIMYTLIVLVLVLLTEIGGVLEHSVDSQVASSTSGYGLRVDFNPATRPSPLEVLRTRTYAHEVSRVAPFTSALARATDPGRRTRTLIDTLVVGVPSGSTTSMQFEKRLPGLGTDTAVWAALAARPDYVVVDPFFGATGGPNGQFYRPGDTFRITDPLRGTAQTKTIVGILRNATVFYSPLQPTSYPVVESDVAVRDQFGSTASISSGLVRTRSGVSADQLGPRLQGQFLSGSLVATPVETTIRRLFDANLAFFQLMEGFLALGLLVGISGLGVVMVRAVRERRRTIGILRALGFRSRSIELSFLVESGFVAFEGVVLGCGLGVLTTWLMYQQSAAFSGIRTGFPVMWGKTVVLAAVTLGASLMATAGPARRAARILPALATRTAD